MTAMAFLCSKCGRPSPFCKNCGALVECQCISTTHSDVKVDRARLRELAGSMIRCPGGGILSDWVTAAPPELVIQLLDQLDATERERDEYQQKWGTRKDFE